MLSQFLNLMTQSLFLFCFTVLFVSGTDKTCVERNENLRDNIEIQITFMEMMEDYNTTCLEKKRCTVTTEPVDTFLTYNYSSFEGRLTYRRLVNTCESQPGYKVCEVTTETVFHSVSDEGKFSTFIKELKKPVCFPPTCSTQQISVLDPTPATCNPSGKTNCNILSYSVNCPDDFIVESDTSTCIENALPITSPFYFQRSLIEAALLASCTDTLSSRQTEMCDFEIGKIQAISKMNLAEFRDEQSYKIHSNKCTQAGGQICVANMHVEFVINGNTIQNITMGDIIVRNTFLEYPQCLPHSCDIDELKGIVAQNFADTARDCDLNSNDCNMTVTNLVCLDYELYPTASPIISITGSPHVPESTNTFPILNIPFTPFLNPSTNAPIKQTGTTSMPTHMKKELISHTSPPSRGMQNGHTNPSIDMQKNQTDNLPPASTDNNSAIPMASFETKSPKTMRIIQIVLIFGAIIVGALIYIRKNR